MNRTEPVMANYFYKSNLDDSRRDLLSRASNSRCSDAIDEAGKKSVSIFVQQMDPVRKL